MRIVESKICFGHNTAASPRQQPRRSALPSRPAQVLVDNLDEVSALAED
jgi:hypothetical protein